jgi:hypothetical protein
MCCHFLHRLSHRCGIIRPHERPGRRRQRDHHPPVGVRDLVHQRVMGQMPPPTYRLAATTCLSLTSVRRRVSDDRPNARHEVALIETEFLREVAMSKKAYRLNAVVRSSRPSGVACPNTRSLAASASLSRRSTTGSSRHGANGWTVSTGTISRRSPARRNAHRPTSRI